MVDMVACLPGSAKVATVARDRTLMTMFRGSVHIYGTMDDAVRLVSIYAKRMALEIGDTPTMIVTWNLADFPRRARILGI